MPHMQSVATAQDSTCPHKPEEVILLARGKLRQVSSSPVTWEIGDENRKKNPQRAIINFKFTRYSAFQSPAQGQRVALYLNCAGSTLADAPKPILHASGVLEKFSTDGRDNAHGSLRIDQFLVMGYIFQLVATPDAPEELVKYDGKRVNLRIIPVTRPLRRPVLGLKIPRDYVSAPH